MRACFVYYQHVNPFPNVRKFIDQAFTGQLVTNCYQLKKPVGDKLTPTENKLFSKPTGDKLSPVKMTNKTANIGSRGGAENAEKVKCKKNMVKPKKALSFWLCFSPKILDGDFDFPQKKILGFLRVLRVSA